MLITCKECGAQISDKAYICVHCGCPIDEKPVRTRSKRPRLPNGFGQITKIKGKNLRKPYRAMVTIGKTSEGRPICKILKPEGYFETYGDAYKALLEYNANPFDLSCEMTMNELYERWSEQYFKNIKPQSIRQYSIAWRQCACLHNLRVREVRTRHLKECINIIEKNSNKRIAKIEFNLMFDYAVEYELTDKNYARHFNLDKSISRDIEANKKNHISFSEAEMKTLWENIIDYPVEMIIVQCYTGLRPKELLDLKLRNIDLKNKNIIAGMKTEAGKDRLVPIHSCIFSIVKARYRKSMKKGSEFLFTLDGYNPIAYSTYRKYFIETLDKLNLNPLHRPHDPRKQFATMAKKYNMDEYALKRILGHHIADITESIYTDRDPVWLHEEIEKIRAAQDDANV